MSRAQTLKERTLVADVLVLCFGVLDVVYCPGDTVKMLRHIARRALVTYQRCSSSGSLSPVDDRGETGCMNPDSSLLRRDVDMPGSADCSSGTTFGLADSSGDETIFSSWGASSLVMRWYSFELNNQNFRFASYVEIIRLA